MDTVTIPGAAAVAAEVFGLRGKEITEVPGHFGGRNVVFEVEGDLFLRFSGLEDRTYEDYLAETEFVHYLAENGAPVADVLPSLKGNYAEPVRVSDRDLVVSLFERAKGDQIADHGYSYLDGAPLEDYFYDTGRVLGRIHALSKKYTPSVKRFDFFDKYNEEYFDSLIPDDFTCGFLGSEPVGAAVKAKLNILLEKLRALPTDGNSYGMIHFDFSDGNYNIDYSDGSITVYDFDNCRTGWYMFDLANLWAHGVGWIAWNGEPTARRKYMDDYFRMVLRGYKSETPPPAGTLSQLPLMVDAVRMENIIDEFEVVLAEEGELSCDGEQAYRLKGLLEDEPYMGFFSEEFDPENPFDLDV